MYALHFWIYTDSGSAPTPLMECLLQKLNHACSFSTVTQGVKLSGVALGRGQIYFNLAAAAAAAMMTTMITASKIVTKTV